MGDVSGLSAGKMGKFGFGIALIVVGWELLTADYGLKMTVCNVGQGLGVIISQGSTQIVYDFGPDNKKMVICLAKTMKLDRRIELAIVSHEDTDHIGGMKEVEKYYHIEQKYYAKDLAVNDKFRIGKMLFDIRWPPALTGDGNKDSVVVEATLDNKKILLMGDVTKEEEDRMVWRKMLRPVDYLVVAHHGSGGSTGENLLEMVKPKTAIISVGKNTFGHPSEEVLGRLKAKNIEILRTDKVGNVIIRTD